MIFILYFVAFSLKNCNFDILTVTPMLIILMKVKWKKILKVTKNSNTNGSKWFYMSFIGFPAYVNSFLKEFCSWLCHFFIWITSWETYQKIRKVNTLSFINLKKLNSNRSMEVISFFWQSKLKIIRKLMKLNDRRRPRIIEKNDEKYISLKGPQTPWWFFDILI